MQKGTPREPSGCLNFQERKRKRGVIGEVKVRKAAGRVGKGSSNGAYAKGLSH